MVLQQGYNTYGLIIFSNQERAGSQNIATYDSPESFHFRAVAAMLLLSSPLPSPTSRLRLLVDNFLRGISNFTNWLFVEGHVFHMADHILLTIILTFVEALLDDSA